MNHGAFKYIIVGGIITLIGILIFIFATSSNFRVKTKGVVSRIEEKEYTNYGEEEKTKDREVYVRYYVDGIERESKLLVGGTFLFRNNQIDVYYYKDFPEIVTTRLIDIWLFVIPIIGLVVAGLGIIKRKEINDKPELSHL